MGFGNKRISFISSKLKQVSQRHKFCAPDDLLQRVNEVVPASISLWLCRKQNMFVQTIFDNTFILFVTVLFFMAHQRWKKKQSYLFEAFTFYGKNIVKLYMVWNYFSKTTWIVTDHFLTDINPLKCQILRFINYS